MQLPFSYVDELLRSEWVRYSEQILSKCPAPALEIPTGFQVAAGATNSHVRSRALELYNLGLLLGPLVNAEDGDFGAIPLGWKLACDEKAVHSNLGYVAYALGKALKEGNTTKNVLDAFGVLCAVFALQLGCQKSDAVALTASLFRYLLTHFPTPPGEKPAEWNRLVAATMFCTLEEDITAAALLRDFKLDVNPKDLVLVNDTVRVEQVSAAKLAESIETGFKIANLKPRKHSLYWIGAQEDTRGIYSLATSALVNEEMLAAAYRIERISIGAGSKSPFAAVWTKNSVTELPDVLSQCEQIFSAAGEQLVWRNAMETLRRGVLSALHHIENDDIVANRQVLYLHGAAMPSGEIDEAELDVPKASCSGKVSKGDLVMVGAHTMEVVTVKTEGERVKVHVLSI